MTERPGSPGCEPGLSRQPPTEYGGYQPTEYGGYQPNVRGAAAG